MKRCKVISFYYWNISFRPTTVAARIRLGFVPLVYILLLITPFAMSDKQELKVVLQGSAKFTQRLYNILSGVDGNVFFSPVSAHTVLSMVYQAAKGPTKDAFSAALSLPNPNVAAEGYNAVMSHLNNTKDVQLHLANKVYIKDGYKLQSAFKTVVQKKFLSEIEQINFGENQKAAANINGWVEKKTNNKIKDLIEPDMLDNDTRAVLVNAIYFKGDWADKFDASNTKTEPFYLNENDTVDCQMMFRKGKYMFKDDQALDAKVLELPYKNRDLSLIVILPNKRNGIENLEERLAETDLTKITEGMYKPDVNVRLPKFKIETTIDLKSALTKLGLGIIFGSDADLSGMIDSKEPLYVSEVIQKAFIEVNEEGAEAAAATAVNVRFKRSLGPSPQINFTADHPFLVMLLSSQILESEEAQQSQNILFYGKVNEPKSSQIVHDEL